MPLIIPANSITGGFEVANSLRFNSGSNDSLTITPSSASNRKTWTFSCWYKGSGTQWSPFSGGGGSSDLRIIIDADGRIRTNINGVGNYNYSNGLFRDVSAWYHLVWKFDTTESTASDRSILYINGTAISDQNSSNFSLNTDYAINTNTLHTISRLSNSDIYHHDGYMSEVCFIDGQALDPTSFGEFDEDSGIWKPKAVSGLTFGTNGFYLDFENSGSLGNDKSGNGNNFTVNNLTSIDQTTDTPTNNYATINPLANSNSSVVLSQGNLFVSTQTSWLSTNSNMGVSSGKWYAEVKLITLGSVRFGIGKVGTTATDTYTISQTNNQASKSPHGYEINHSDGNKVNNNVSSSYGSAFSVNDIGMIAFDCDNGTIWIGKNGTWFNSATQSEIENGITTNAMYSGITIDDFFLFTNSAETTGGGTVNGETSWNFGNPSFTISSGNSDANGYGNFEYAVPSGYYALNTKNLSEFG